MIIDVVVTCGDGTEPVLERELQLLGLTDLRRERGAVLGCGTLEQAARICLWSRVASRVLLPLFDVESTSTDALYDAAVEYPWADVLNPRGTIAVHATAARNTKIHTQYVSLKLKDAVVDHCRDHHGVRPSVNVDRPDVPLQVHATLAGVTLAFCIPLRTKNAEPSPLLTLEHALHPWVAYGILPLFAFANAGLSLSGVTAESFTHNVPMGIAIGLLLGKAIGVYGLTWLAVKIGIAALPQGANWGQVLGVAILCGIGFTMSLFVGSLAFEPGVSDYAGMDRMGILTGSILAALIGYAVTAAASRKPVLQTA